MHKQFIYNFLFVIFASVLIFGGLVQTFGGSFYPELSYLNKKNLQFSDLQKFFKQMADKKGALYAFSALKIAKLPPNTDVHLLGHTIGDILYKQKGLDGIKYCTQDFRNSCSHSIVVGLFVERGSSALDDIAEVCRTAPGGTGAYGMCFHGLGHGILAFAGYNMEKAVELCRKAGTEQTGYIETAECVGGVVMEMVAGVHDKSAWEKERGKYLLSTKPLSPCTEPFVPAVAKPNCFLYITPHLWEAAGGDLGNPTDAVFSKSFAYCEQLKGENAVYKELCYGGFGKEFVGLAQSRDIRNIGAMGEAELGLVYKWCNLAGNMFGIKSCVKQAINSLYWGGENELGATIKFCGIVTDEEIKESCFNHVIGSFRFYQRSNPKKLEQSCKNLPEPYNLRCVDPGFIEK